MSDEINIFIIDNTTDPVELALRVKERLGELQAQRIAAEWEPTEEQIDRYIKSRERALMYVPHKGVVIAHLKALHEEGLIS